jgi:hypothetical protein
LMHIYVPRIREDLVMSHVVSVVEMFSLIIAYFGCIGVWPFLVIVRFLDWLGAVMMFRCVCACIARTDFVCSKIYLFSSLEVSQQRDFLLLCVA